MNIPVYSLQGEKTGEVALGRAFSFPVREDVIRRAFLAEQAAGRQPYGADPLAGKRTSAHYHGLRGYRWSMMNREMARMKRIHSQGALNYRARFVPQAVKGRKAHPPKVEKKWGLKVNRKERLLGLLSALSATARKDFLQARGHPLPATLPLVLEDAFQELGKTREALQALGKLGLDVQEQRSIRAGKGKRRGRRYRKAAGPLIILTAGKLRSLPGADIRMLKDLKIADLAPGGQPGRLCIWTVSSLQEAGKL